MHQYKISNFVIENSSILTEYISWPIISTVHITCLLCCPCMLDSHSCRTTRGKKHALVFLLPLKDKCILSLTNDKRAKGASLQVPGQKEWEIVQAGLCYLPTVEDGAYDFQKETDFFSTYTPMFYNSTHITYKLWSLTHCPLLNIFSLARINVNVQVGFVYEF